MSRALCVVAAGFALWTTSCAAPPPGRLDDSSTSAAPPASAPRAHVGNGPDQRRHGAPVVDGSSKRAFVQSLEAVRQSLPEDRWEELDLAMQQLRHVAALADRPHADLAARLREWLHGVNGAGILLAGSVPASTTAHAPRLVLREHVTPMSFTLTLPNDGVAKCAVVEFLFVYAMDAAAEKAVAASIDRRWGDAFARCLALLKRQVAGTFADAQAMSQLAHALAAQLTASLFPDGMAVVDDILWRKVIVQ